MITFVVFVTVFLVYITILFFRGIYREKKDNKIKKTEDEILDEEDS